MGSIENGVLEAESISGVVFFFVHNVMALVVPMGPPFVAGTVAVNPRKALRATNGAAGLSC
jgi:hypothetical protein